MKKTRNVYVCGQCGYQSGKWFGRCPVCDAWNAFEEEEVSDRSPKTGGRKKEVELGRPIGTIDISEGQRYTIDGGELDVLFGGGLVKGSAILIGGEPGIGKSTLLTQLAAAFAEKHGVALYATGEESLKQVRLRAERLDAVAADFYLLAENNLAHLAENIDKIKPRLLIVDSIQTLYDESLDSIPGSVGQIRECTAKLLHLAKKQQMIIMIAGHVTKEGVIAGPRLLEHMVDVVLYFEGERHQGFRVLRGVKNRFGSTNEVVLLEMTGRGLLPFANPSAVFLAQRSAETAGNAVSAIMEGSRPFLLEVQALVSKTPFGQPRRLAAGLEYNRLLLIIAVLEKVIGLALSNEDIYLNVTGGLKIYDPTSDLAVAAAICSSYRNTPIGANTIFLGEIGLGGEIRCGGDMERRIREGLKFGFQRFVIPEFLSEKIDIGEGKGTLYPVKTLREALFYLEQE